MNLLKCYLIGSLLTIHLLLSDTAKGCGIYVSTGDYSRVSFFQPDLGKAQGMYPFFFSSSIYFDPQLYNYTNWFYDDNRSFISSDTNNIEYYTLNNLIIRDWKLYLSKQVDTKDIDAILNHTETIFFFQKLDSLREHNSFVKELHKPVHQEVLLYLFLLKKSELISNYDPWTCEDCPDINNGTIVWKNNTSTYNYNYNTGRLTRNQLEQISLVVKKLTQLITQTQNEFIKQRGAYLLCRLYFYMGDIANVKLIYNTILGNTSNGNYLKWHALLYAASSEEIAKRNYLLSQAFFHCPSARYNARFDFDLRYTEQTLALTQNAREKATILIMSILRRPGNCLNTLKQIIQLDPHHPFLTFVFSREINKLEDIFLSPRFTGFGQSVVTGRDPFYTTSFYPNIDDEEENWPKFTKAAHAVKQAKALYALFIRPDVLKSNPSLYHLCAGYIAYLLQDFYVAQLHYAQCRATSPKDIKLLTQLKLNTLALTISLSDSITPKIEQGIADYINDLAKYRHLYFHYDYMHAQFTLVMGKLLIDKKEVAKGIMLLAHSKQHADFQHPYYVKNAYNYMLDLCKEKDYSLIISHLQKERKSPFEKILCAAGIQHIAQYAYWEDTATYAWDINKIYDMQCMYHIRRNEINKAFRIASYISTSYWQTWPYRDLFSKDDPFWVDPSNFHLPNNLGNHNYNKYTILKKVLQLIKQKNNSSGDTKALACFQLANFYLSSTEYGKYWILRNNYIMTYDDYPASIRREVPSFFNTDLAIEYYRQAALYAKSPRIKAMSVMMAWISRNKVKNSPENPYLALIKNNSGAEVYYEQYTNCQLIPEFFQTYYQ